MTDILIEQAIYSNAEAGGYRFLARSAGFQADWLPEAERLCAGFGERPAGVACPEAVFAQPLGAGHVAVIQVADQGADDADRPGALGFRLLVLPRLAYADYIGDPFLLADRFPPPWHERGALPALSWPIQPLPPRTVDEIQHVLKTGDSPTLLGSAQALLDAGKVVFEKPAPDPDLLRHLWLLLPHSTRNQLWPASFAFSNALGFDALVVPRIPAEQCAGYLTGDQAGDYPEGRYEFSLQMAVEAGDQQELDALFARRSSSSQTMRLGFYILAAMVVLAFVMNFLTLPPTSVPPTSPPTSGKTGPASVPAPEGPKLADRYPPLSPEIRQPLAEALRDLAETADLGPLPEPATIEELIDVVSLRLIPPAGAEDARSTDVYRRWQQTGLSAHPERCLRALLWAHGVAGYDDPRLNMVELVELLQTKLVR